MGSAAASSTRDLKRSQSNWMLGPLRRVGSSGDIFVGYGYPLLIGAGQRGASHLKLGSAIGLLR